MFLPFKKKNPLNNRIRSLEMQLEDANFRIAQLERKLDDANQEVSSLVATSAKPFNETIEVIEAVDTDQPKER